MARYINKDAFVAEIENLENTYKKCSTRNSYEEGLKDGRLIGYKDALHKINTIEVKEIGVDLGDPKGDKIAKHIINTKTHEVKEVDLDFTKEPVSEELDTLVEEEWLFNEKIEVDCLESIPLTKSDLSALVQRIANWQKEQMMKGAKSGIGNYDNYIKFEDGTWIDLDPSEQLKPAFNVNEGDKVKVIVIKEE